MINPLVALPELKILKEGGIALGTGRLSHLKIVFQFPGTFEPFAT